MNVKLNQLDLLINKTSAKSEIMNRVLAASLLAITATTVDLDLLGEKSGAINHLMDPNVEYIDPWSADYNNPNSDGS